MEFSALVRAIEADTSDAALALRLAPAQWQRLAGQMQRRELHPGDLLIRRADIERAAYLVERGHLQVFVSGGPAGSHRISTLRAGTLVGESSWFSALPRMASVEATTSCIVWALSAERLALLAADDPRLALALLQAAGALMVQRVRAHQERGLPWA